MEFGGQRQRGSGRSRRDQVTVPHLIGMRLGEAQWLGVEMSLVVLRADGSPAGDENDWVVDQTPSSGRSVARSTVVTVFTRNSPPGEGGVREPRRPLPGPGGVQQEAPIPSPTPPLPETGDLPPDPLAPQAL